MDLENKPLKPLPESAIQAAKEAGHGTLEDVLRDLNATNPETKDQTLTDDERDKIDQLLD
jgi:hypothetical protein